MIQEIHEGPTKVDGHINNAKTWTNKKRPRRENGYTSAKGQAQGISKEVNMQSGQAGDRRENNSEYCLREVINKGSILS